MYPNFNINLRKVFEDLTRFTDDYRNFRNNTHPLGTVVDSMTLTFDEGYLKAVIAANRLDTYLVYEANAYEASDAELMVILTNITEGIDYIEGPDIDVVKLLYANWLSFVCGSRNEIPELEDMLRKANDRSQYLDNEFILDRTNFEYDQVWYDDPDHPIEMFSPVENKKRLNSY